MRLTRGEKSAQVIIVVILAGITATAFYPLWYVAMYSISDPGRAMEGGAFVFPRGFSLIGFRRILQSSQAFVAYRNSIFRLVVGTVINTVLTASLAYPLSRKRFYGRNALSFFVFFTMLFNGGMIPMYLLVRSVGLLNSLWALVIPTAISPFNFFIMRNYFQSVPHELEETALIDGAGPVRILVQVFLPVAKPVIAAVALLYAVFHWNEFFTAVLYLHDQENEILQMYLRRLFATSALAGVDGMQAIMDDFASLTEGTMRMVAVMAGIVPMMILYPFIQKHYVKGLLIGSIKG